MKLLSKVIEEKVTDYKPVMDIKPIILIFLASQMNLLRNQLSLQEYELKTKG